MGNGVVSPYRRTSSEQTLSYEPIRKVFKIITSEIKWKRPFNSEDRACLESLVSKLKNELYDNEIQINTLQKNLLETQKKLQTKEHELLELQREVHKLKVIFSL